VSLTIYCEFEDENRKYPYVMICDKIESNPTPV